MRRMGRSFALLHLTAVGISILLLLALSSCGGSSRPGEVGRPTAQSVEQGAVQNMPSPTEWASDRSEANPISPGKPWGPAAKRPKLLPLRQEGEIGLLAFDQWGNPSPALTNSLEVSSSPSPSGEVEIEIRLPEGNTSGAGVMVFYDAASFHVASATTAPISPAEGLALTTQAGRGIYALGIYPWRSQGVEKIALPNRQLGRLILAPGSDPGKGLSQVPFGAPLGSVVYVSDQLPVGTHAPAGLWLPGDMNGNLAVGFDDVNTLVSSFGKQAGYEEGEAPIVADLVRDGQVDFADVNLFVASFGFQMDSIRFFVGSGELSLDQVDPEQPDGVISGLDQIFTRIGPEGFPLGSLAVPLGTSGTVAYLAVMTDTAGEETFLDNALSPTLTIPQLLSGPVSGELTGNFLVPSGETATVEGPLTIHGDLVVLGTLESDGSTLNLTVNGDLELGPESLLQSLLPEGSPSDPEQETQDGIVVVVGGNFFADPGSNINTNGNLVMVDDPSYIPTNADGQLDAEAVNFTAGDIEPPPASSGASLFAPLDSYQKLGRLTAGEEVKFFSAGGGKGLADAPEVVDIDPVAGFTGQATTFTATLDNNFPPADQWNWDFDGGATPQLSTDPSPTVTLGNPGAYVGELTVTSPPADGAESESIRFVYLVFQDQNALQPLARIFNNCANINLNPPPLPVQQIAAWIFNRARQSGCLGYRGGAVPPGPGGVNPPLPVPPLPFPPPPPPPPPPPQFQAFNVNFPNGKDGRDVIGGCGTVRGGHGRNAPGYISWTLGDWVNNLSLTLNMGDGGKGGDATANCDQCGSDARAIGGRGGRPSRLSVKAGFNLGFPMRIIINGPININVGAGGDGGNAQATTADCPDGCPGGDAGNATAIGGRGGPSTFAVFAGGGNVGPPGFSRRTSGIIFWSLGGQEGLSNVTVGGNLDGGKGGDATASAGRGGNGNGCGCDGGKGGNAVAVGGKGGEVGYEAKSSAAQEVVDATGGISGDGGNVTVQGGDGGKGKDCNCQNQRHPGGNGGDGGNAQFKRGLAGPVLGTGTQLMGSNGWIHSDGGNGGAGGNGNPPGAGGAGGISSELSGNPSTVGQDEINDGLPGPDGGPLNCPLFMRIKVPPVQPPDGPVSPANQILPLFDLSDNEIGNISLFFQYPANNLEAGSIIHKPQDNPNPGYSDRLEMMSQWLGSDPSPQPVYLDVELNSSSLSDGSPLPYTRGIDVSPATDSQNNSYLGFFGPDFQLVIQPLDPNRSPIEDPDTAQPFLCTFNSFPSDFPPDGDPTSAANDSWRCELPTGIDPSQVSFWRIASTPTAPNGIGLPTISWIDLISQ